MYVLAFIALYMYLYFQYYITVFFLTSAVFWQQFWFQLWNGYSGQIIYERWTLGLYNVVCIHSQIDSTKLPLLVILVYMCICP